MVRLQRVRLWGMIAQRRDDWISEKGVVAIGPVDQAGLEGSRFLRRDSVEGSPEWAEVEEARWRWRSWRAAQRWMHFGGRPRHRVRMQGLRGERNHRLEDGALVG